MIEYVLPCPDSAPFGITEGNNGDIWFTEMNGNRIGRILSSGEMVEYDLPNPGSYPSFIVVGPDGAPLFYCSWPGRCHLVY